jgi:hypothetical protein
MKIRMLIVAAAAVASAFSVSGAASAKSDSGYDGDTRHCVTAREVFLVGGSLTRAQIEKRWEMEGRGERGYIPLFGLKGYLYKMCDRDPRVAFAIFDNGYATVYGVWEHKVEPAPAPLVDPDPCPECTVVP